MLKTAIAVFVVLLVIIIALAFLGASYALSGIKRDDFPRIGGSDE